MKIRHQKILAEVMDAYADCRLPYEQAAKIRNLSFRASLPVYAAEAQEILEAAGVKQYNAFESHLLRKFPANALIRIAREGSVCLYVSYMRNLPSAQDVDADEVDNIGGEVRYWWD